MSFTDIMNRILPPLEDGKYFANFSYYPIGPDGDEMNPNKCDYDHWRNDNNNIHGGVDILYWKTVNDTQQYIGSKVAPNKDHPSVYAPVEGEVIWKKGGTISILREGYVHTIKEIKGDGSL